MNYKGYLAERSNKLNIREINILLIKATDIASRSSTRKMNALCLGVQQFALFLHFYIYGTTFVILIIQDEMKPK